MKMVITHDIDARETRIEGERGTWDEGTAEGDRRTIEVANELGLAGRRVVQIIRRVEHQHDDRYAVKLKWEIDAK